MRNAILGAHIRLATSRTASFVRQAPFRRYQSTTIDLLKLLRQNTELSAEDAKNELRWIQLAVRSDPLVIRSRDEDDGSLLKGLVERRAQGEPLQYVLGSTDFGPLTLKCKSPVLIPRPETEHITTLLTRSILAQRPETSRPLDIVDLCSGSGCIALLLADRLGRHANLTGIDISPDAIDLAKENAKFTGIPVQFRRGDLWKDNVLGDKVDILVSNPPYIPRHEWDELDTGVKKYEDPLALIGDPQDVPLDPAPGESALAVDKDGDGSDGKGLAFYRRIAHILPGFLTSNENIQEKGWSNIPRVAVEIGYGQAKDVQAIFMNDSEGMITRTEVWNDQYDVERMVVGWTT